MVLLAYFLATAAAGAAFRTLRGAFVAAKRRHQRWYDALRGPSAGEWSCTSRRRDGARDRDLDVVHDTQ